MNTVNDWRPKDVVPSDRLHSVGKVRQGAPIGAYQAAEKDAVMNMGVALVRHLIAHSGKIVAYRAQANWQPDYIQGWSPQDEFVVDARIVAVVHQDEPRVFMGHSWSIPAPEPPYEILRIVRDPQPYPAPARLQDMRAGLLVKELWRQFRAFMDRQEACSFTRPQSSYPDEYWFTNWR